MPIVSFIVPIYNSAIYLRQCLDSILSQSIADYEVILINDGSTDDSGKICDEYVRLDYRFKVFHKQNNGLSAARNDGIELAHGEWITFVDSDDWVEPNFIEQIISHRDVDYVITSIYHQYSCGRIAKETFIDNTICLINNNIFVKENLKLAFFTAWSKFFKTRIIKDNNLRFLEGVSPGEDTIFVFQYINSIQSVYLSDIPCYNWRVANGLTNKKRSFNCIEYTISQTLIAIEHVESKYNLELSYVKFQSLHYLLDKIDIGRYSYKQLCSEIRNIYSKLWMKEVIKDNTYLEKGLRRRVMDILTSNKMFCVVAICCKLTHKFY